MDRKIKSNRVDILVKDYKKQTNMHSKNNTLNLPLCQ